MEKRFCPYCGELLTEGCYCEIEAARFEAEEREYLLEEIEERQHQSGFYAFQDLIDMYRMER